MDHNVLTGKTCRDYHSVKEKYLLSWEVLSKTEVDTILGIVALGTAVDFYINVEGFQISLTSVIPYVASISYSVLGDSYIGSLELELIEEET